MIEFVRHREMAFIATADAVGRSDCSVRSGAAGFIQVLDSKRIAYPEYRGNGVMASLGNISENPHIGLLLLDLAGDVVGLRINGTATILDDIELDVLFERGRRPERWVVTEVEEAYLH
jgi:predicted pyridoxine 5'-phosphate oxidase superfamily flavin-nucleotide-binding protein